MGHRTPRAMMAHAAPAMIEAIAPRISLAIIMAREKSMLSSSRSALAADPQGAAVLLQRHPRKIHRYIQRHVDIVGEQVQRDVRDDLHHLAVIEAGFAQLLHRGVAHLSALLDDFQRKT